MFCIKTVSGLLKRLKYYKKLLKISNFFCSDQSYQPLAALPPEQLRQPSLVRLVAKVLAFLLQTQDCAVLAAENHWSSLLLGPIVSYHQLGPNTCNIKFILNQFDEKSHQKIDLCVIVCISGSAWEGCTNLSGMKEV